MGAWVAGWRGAQLAAIAPYRLEFRPYQRQFQTPLHTHHGLWTTRTGLILRLESADGRVGWGEVAPVPWFGSETLAAAIARLTALPPILSMADLHALPATHPACQFGLALALADCTAHDSEGWAAACPAPSPRATGQPVPPFFRRPFTQKSVKSLLTLDSPRPLPPSSKAEKEELERVGGPFLSPQMGEGNTRGEGNLGDFYSVDHALRRGRGDHPTAALLPTGAAALTHWPPLWHQGFRTFKWKIGVAPPATEIAWFRALVAQLPTGAKLRLDANGALSLAQAETWLAAIAGTPVEFLEQPLPPAELAAMVDLAARSPIPLALDESVSQLASLQHCYAQGWRGIFVVKPAIAGDPVALCQFCQQKHLDVVISTVFETAIGQGALWRLAATLMRRDRAVGLGHGTWFPPADPLAVADPEALWQQLATS